MPCLQPTVPLSINGVTLGFPVSWRHPGTSCGSPGAQLALGDEEGAEQPPLVATIGVNDTCPIHHPAPVSQMEKQQSAALPGAAHLA